MVEPVPSTLRSLQDAIERKLTELDPFLEKLRDEHSLETHARKAGYTQQKLNDAGEPIADSLDWSTVPREAYIRLREQSEPHALFGHDAKSMINVVLGSLFSQELSL